MKAPSPKVAELWERVERETTRAYHREQVSRDVARSRVVRRMIAAERAAAPRTLRA